VSDARSTLYQDFFGLDDLLTEEEREVRERVSAFSDAEVIPIMADCWERGEFPFQLVPKLAALGICGDTIRGYGCAGLSAVGAGFAAMELARGDGSINTFFGATSGFAINTIADLGSDEQKEMWIPGMARLEKLGAFALTEPEHGSDAVMLQTKARREGDEYVIDGKKRWIGNGTVADVIIIWARDENDERGGFLVEKGSFGLKASGITGKASKRPGIQADLSLEGVRVPVENRLPGARTFKDTTSALAVVRCGVAWEALGHALHLSSSMGCGHGLWVSGLGWKASGIFGSAAPFMCCSISPLPPSIVPRTSPPQKHRLPFTSKDCRSYIRRKRSPLSRSHRIVSSASCTRTLVRVLSHWPSVTLTMSAMKSSGV
jgi:glutaryl-CoA dehydrogenase